LSTLNTEPENPRCFRMPFSWMVVCINVGSNLVGFFLVQVLLGYAQPLKSWHKSLILDVRDALTLLAILVPAAAAILVLLASPVSSALRALRSGGAPRPEQLEAARRRAINLPFYVALMNLVAWIVPVVAFPLQLGLHSTLPWSIVGLFAAYNFTNALMITLLAFIFLEHACRRTAVPLLFPEGRVRDQKGTVRLTIRKRLMLMYGAICLGPMVQTALVMNANASLDASLIDPPVVLKNLGTFALILFCFTALYGLWLAALFARNLSAPAREIIEVAEKVTAGDYGTQVGVVSNDEIGYLGDRVNEMSRGLKERERIREMFNLFTSPEIGKEILSGRTFAGGELRRVTLLFSDLRGFTTMAERLPPEQVVESINSYFSEMSTAIVENGGIVLQYVGDEIEAVFGAPMDDPRHADKAVAAALAMRERLDTLNRHRTSRGEEPFRHGVGVHTGTALAGIVGSRYKLSYAMVGDNVNIASRIQELNKELESDILISGDTRSSLTENYVMSEGVTVSVKGRERPLEVYRLMA
jgi:adenylate cyclase